jgi:hypothetical protein
MRRTVLFLMTAVLFTACNEQKSARDVFESYEGEPGVYSFRVPPTLFAAMMGEAGQDGVSDFEGVDLVKVLIFSEKEARETTHQEMLQDMTGRMKEMDFEELIRFSGSGANIVLQVKHHRGEESVVTDVIVLAMEEESFVALGLSGKMQLKDIARFASTVDYDQLKKLN